MPAYLKGESASHLLRLLWLHTCRCMSAGGGKSACYRSLQAAQTAIMQQQPGRRLAAAVQEASGAAIAGDQAADSSSQAGVQAHVLNPKAIPLAELYGSHNAVTNEWTDGLASRMIRASVADERDAMHWVVFDGPVDAGWVESMNTGEWVAVNTVCLGVRGVLIPKQRAGSIGVWQASSWWPLHRQPRHMLIKSAVPSCADCACAHLPCGCAQPLTTTACCASRVVSASGWTSQGCGCCLRWRT